MFLIEFQSTLKNKQSCYNYRKNIFINLKSLSRNIQNMSISWCSRCVFSRYIYIFLGRSKSRHFSPKKNHRFAGRPNRFSHPPTFTGPKVGRTSGLSSDDVNPKRCVNEWSNVSRVVSRGGWVWGWSSHGYINPYYWVEKIYSPNISGT